MFNNPGEVLKKGTVAGVILGTLVGGILGALVGNAFDDKGFIGFLLGAGIVFLISYTNSLIILAFADMVENVNDMRQILYSIKHTQETKEIKTSLSDISPISSSREENIRTWKCTRCGKVMPINVETCQCGSRKSY